MDVIAIAKFPKVQLVIPERMNVRKRLLTVSFIFRRKPLPAAHRFARETLRVKDL